MKRVLVSLLISCVVQSSEAARLKDITTIEGVQSHQLIGYGLVVGLKGTGDGYRSLFTQKSVQNMLQNFGLFTTNSRRGYTKNVAAVMVTAELQTFKGKGTTIDVRVASIGDAKSLKDGVLLLTPLKGIDGSTYATAQGNVVISNEEPTTGYILNGGIIHLPIATEINDTVIFLLITPDFTSAVRVQDALNTQFGTIVATAIDGSKIKVAIPEKYKDKPLEFISRIEEIEIPIDVEEKVVVDGLTGTIVSGLNVKIYPVRLNYKELKVEVLSETPLSEFIDMIYTVGIPSKEIVNIIRTLKSSGAIGAHVVII